MPIARLAKQLIAYCLAMLPILTTSPANAGLMGDTVHAEYMFPEPYTVLADLGNSVVADGPEFALPLGNNEIIIDISDSSIFITMFGVDSFFPSAPFTGFHFSFDTINPIAHVTVASSHDFNLGLYPIAAGGNDIFLNLEGQKIAADSSLTLDITFIKEPLTGGLFTTGLIAMGTVIRSRRR